MWVVVVIVVVAVVLIVGCMIMRGPVNKSINEAHNQHSEWLSQRGANITVEYIFEPVSGTYARYIVDAENKRVLIIYRYMSIFGKCLYYEIPFPSVNGTEIFEDKEVSGGISRAIIGGALAGEAGAMVGAVTAKKHVETLDVMIYTKNIENPQITLRLIFEKTSTDSKLYKDAVGFSRQVNASIKAIMSNED